MTDNLTLDEITAIKNKGFIIVKEKPKVSEMYISFGYDKETNSEYSINYISRGTIFLRCGGDFKDNTTDFLEKIIGTLLVKYPEKTTEKRNLKLYIKDEKYNSIVNNMVEKYK